MKKGLLWGLMLSLPLLLTFILLELAVRAVYYQREGPHTLAIAHLETRIRGLITGMPGKRLSREAWNASFTDLGQAPPETGPRDGFSGQRTNPKNADCGYLIICESDQLIDGLADIRDNGLQYAGKLTAGGDATEILIIGGSVAFGAYASSIDSAYFSVLQSALEAEGLANRITVAARGAARSEDDLAAFVLRGLALKPDAVVFLNGLNDIYIPGTDGIDMDAREYVRNMEVARQLAERNGIEFYVVLQPFPTGKKQKTKYERAILSRVAVAGFADEQEVERIRDTLLSEFESMTAPHDDAHFVDCSGAFDNESVNIFSDQWHFADFGQQLLADCIASALLPIAAKGQ